MWEKYNFKCCHSEKKRMLWISPPLMLGVRHSLDWLRADNITKQYNCWNDRVRLSVSTVTIHPHNKVVVDLMLTEPSPLMKMKMKYYKTNSGKRKNRTFETPNRRHSPSIDATKKWIEEYRRKKRMKRYKRDHPNRRLAGFTLWCHTSAKNEIKTIASTLICAFFDFVLCGVFIRFIIFNRMSFICSIIWWIYVYSWWNLMKKIKSLIYIYIYYIEHGTKLTSANSEWVAAVYMFTSISLNSNIVHLANYIISVNKLSWPSIENRPQNDERPAATVKCSIKKLPSPCERKCENALKISLGAAYERAGVLNATRLPIPCKTLLTSCNVHIDSKKCRVVQEPMSFSVYEFT